MFKILIAEDDKELRNLFHTFSSVRATQLRAFPTERKLLTLWTPIFTT